MIEKEVLYAKWLSGEISDQEIISQEGADVLAELQRLKKTVDQWSMPKYDTSKGYEKFKHKHVNQKAKIRKINWFKLSGIAASLLVLVFAFNSFLFNKNEVLRAQNGLTENLAFSDGSEVWLNDGSSIEYNAKKWETKRNINLEGEALFHVSKGSPFVVHTQNGDVRVLGTQFNVRAWGENLFVECYEGKVQVEANGQKTILTLGQTVNVVQGNMKEKQRTNQQAPSWQSGTSRFFNEKLNIVFEELERQYDVTINFDRSDQHFSGKFNHDNLEIALRDICKPLGLTFVINDDQNVVVIE